VLVCICGKVQRQVYGLGYKVRVQMCRNGLQVYMYVCVWYLCEALKWLLCTREATQGYAKANATLR